MTTSLPSSLQGQTWFITGCSTGFGRELAMQLLQGGANVVATARKPETLAELTQRYGDKVLALALDVTDKAQITAAVQQAAATFGGIDVLVNNAGYGYISSIEEGEDTAIRAMFDTNVFGLIAVTQAALPVMRQKSGATIVNLSSIAGLRSGAASGFYCATKYAVEAISDAVREETSACGMKVMVVNPGPFRTDFAGRSIQMTPTKIETYQATVGARQTQLSGYDGNQPGDPVRACTAIIDAVCSGNPPAHLLLGKVVYDIMSQKVKTFAAEIEAGKETAINADYPADSAAA